MASHCKHEAVQTSQPRQEGLHSTPLHSQLNGYSSTKCAYTIAVQRLLLWITNNKHKKGERFIATPVVGMHHPASLRQWGGAIPVRAEQKPSRPTVTPQELIRSGAVRAIPVGEAASALRTDGYRVLDIRPAWEWEKARVGDSLHVPLFVEDTDMGPVTLVKKWVHLGYIGLWTGQRFTTMNDRFLRLVEEAVPDKEAKLLVACGEGLRSLIALKILHTGGYVNLGWLAGGFNRVVDGDFSDVQGTTKLQYATVGGASYYFLQVLLFLQVLGKEN